MVTLCITFLKCFASWKCLNFGKKKQQPNNHLADWRRSYACNVIDTWRRTTANAAAVRQKPAICVCVSHPDLLPTINQEFLLTRLDKRNKGLAHSAWTGCSGCSLPPSAPAAALRAANSRSLLTFNSCDCCDYRLNFPRRRSTSKRFSAAVQKSVATLQYRWLTLFVCVLSKCFLLSFYFLWPKTQHFFVQFQLPVE